MPSGVFSSYKLEFVTQLYCTRRSRRFEKCIRVCDAENDLLLADIRVFLFLLYSLCTRSGVCHVVDRIIRFKRFLIHERRVEVIDLFSCGPRMIMRFDCSLYNKDCEECALRIYDVATFLRRTLE